MIAFTFVRKSASFLHCYLPKKIIFITYFKFENFSCLKNYFFNCIITYSQKCLKKTNLKRFLKTNWENVYENTLKHFPCVRGNLHIWFSNLLKLQLTGLAINNVPGCTNCNFLSFSNLAVKGNRRMKCTFGHRRDVNQNMLYQSFGHSARDWKQ